MTKTKAHVDAFHPRNNRQPSYHCVCGALHKIWSLLRDKPELCVYCQADIDYTVVPTNGKTE